MNIDFDDNVMIPTESVLIIAALVAVFLVCAGLYLSLGVGPEALMSTPFIVLRFFNTRRDGNA